VLKVQLIFEIVIAHPSAARAPERVTLWDLGREWQRHLENHSSDPLITLAANPPFGKVTGNSGLKTNL
jgi:hypothetical protein